MSRLDDARSPEKEIHDIKKSLISGMAPVDMARHCVSERIMAEPKTPHSTPKAQLKGDYEEHSDIIEKLCEYLFDLFDANCMDDFIRMERFELRAVESFRNDEGEYTHEQYDLHKEFTCLFEQLVEGFLENEGYSIEEFYKVLKHFVRKSGSVKNKPKIGSPGYYSSGEVTPADEVMEVISSYMDFHVWAGLMRKQAQHRGVFLTTKDKLIQAAAAVVSENAAAATAAANSATQKETSPVEEKEHKDSHNSVSNNHNNDHK